MLKLPAKYSRQGGNASPPLRIEGVPENAKSLVLIVDDPDARLRLFTHWLLWNIDPKTTEIAEQIRRKAQCRERMIIRRWVMADRNRLRARIVITSKFSRLIELSTFQKAQNGKELDKAMNGHVIAQGQLMGRYTRRK